MSLLIRVESNGGEQSYESRWGTSGQTGCTGVGEETSRKTDPQGSKTGKYRGRNPKAILGLHCTAAELSASRAKGWAEGPGLIVPPLYEGQASCVSGPLLTQPLMCAEGTFGNSLKEQ